MFRGEHALLQVPRRIAWFDGDLHLAEQLSSVEFFGDDVHGAAADLIAGFDCSRVGVEAAVLGQQ
jgi:hypothetical protein